MKKNDNFEKKIENFEINEHFEKKVENYEKKIENFEKKIENFEKNTNVCRVVCFNGGNAFNGNAKARCDTFTNNVTTAGKWRTNRNANPSCRAEDEPNKLNGKQAAYINN